MLQTNELQLIKQIKEWTGSRFIGDDCAVLPGGTLVSSDSLVEGTHFRLDWTSLEALGWKACAVNLSDIAAMAGRATYLTVSLTVPKSMDERAFKQFYTGFAKCASSYRRADSWRRSDFRTCSCHRGHGVGAGARERLLAQKRSQTRRCGSCYRRFRS